MWRRILALSALLAGLAFSAGVAKADFRSCNVTGDTINVAFGYWVEPDDWISTGWTRVETGFCYIHTQGELNNRYFYVYAEDDEIYRTWQAPEGQTGGNFCIADDAFNFLLSDYTEGDNTVCDEEVTFVVQFVEIDVGDQTADYTYTFRAADAFLPVDDPGAKSGKTTTPVPPATLK